MTAIETLGEPKNRRERAHDAAALPGQLSVAVVIGLGRGAAMIARDEGDCLDLVRLEPAQVGVLDQVMRMLVVALVADVHADVVEDRGVLKPFALAVGEPVYGARLVEQGDGQPGDLVRVLRPVVAAFRQLDDTAAA